jgi:WD40 repeat protein
MRHIYRISILIALIGLLTTPLFTQNIEWSRKANPSSLSINSVAFRSDGQQVLSGTNCHPASIRIFEVADGSLTWDYNVGFTYMCIMGVAFSANSDFIAAVEEFGNIFLFDNTGAVPQIIDTIDAGTTYGFAIDISPQNDKMAVGLSSGTLKLYNLPGGTLSNNVFAHTGWVTTVAYAPDGTRIVTGGSDGRIKVWTDAASHVLTCAGHTGRVTAVKVSHDNQYIISSGVDNTIKIWELATGTLVRTLTGHTDDVSSIDISPDGGLLVSGCVDGWCKVWDFATGTALATFGVPDSGGVNSVAWSPQGDRIATGNSRSDLVLWRNLPAVGTEETALQADLYLYPNPATGSVQLNLPAAVERAEVWVYNVWGQAVRHLSDLPAGQHRLHLDGLSPGRYLIQARAGGHSLSQPLVIMH